MKSLLVAVSMTAIVIPLAHADQTDSMVVVLKDSNGHVAVRKQAAPHSTCVTLLEVLRKEPVVLTLLDPYAKGRVIEAYCVLPDGSLLKWPANAGP